MSQVATQTGPQSRLQPGPPQPRPRYSSPPPVFPSGRGELRQWVLGYPFAAVPRGAMSSTNAFALLSLSLSTSIGSPAEIVNSLSWTHPPARESPGGPRRICYTDIPCLRRNVKLSSTRSPPSADGRRPNRLRSLLAAPREFRERLTLGRPLAEVPPELDWRAYLEHYPSRPPSSRRPALIPSRRDAGLF